MDLRIKTVQQLPQSAIEKIFKYLPLKQVSRLGTECTSFRNASKTVLVSAIRRLNITLNTEMEKLENNAKTSNPEEGPRYQNLALLHTVLKVLQSELVVVRACCWRYMRDPTINFCFPAGDLIDEYYNVLSLVRDHEVSKELEPEITTHLFLHTEKFLDFFDTVIESGLTKQGSASQAGIKIMDILDCCQTSNYKVRLNHTPDNSTYILEGMYELRDIGTIDKPPTMGTDISMELKLRSVTRFLRNHVRWNNLFNLLKELWELEDSIENNKEPPIRPLCHSKIKFTKITPRKEETSSRSLSPQPCEDVFSRNILHIGTRIGVECKMMVHAPQLPLCLEWLEENHIKNSLWEGGKSITMGIETEGSPDAEADSSTTESTDTEVQTDMFFLVRDDEHEEELAIQADDNAAQGNKETQGFCGLNIPSGLVLTEFKKAWSKSNIPDDLSVMEKERGRLSNTFDLRSTKLKEEIFTNNVALNMNKESMLEIELKIQTPSNEVPGKVVESVISVHRANKELKVMAIKDGALVC